MEATKNCLISLFVCSEQCFGFGFRNSLAVPEYGSRRKVFLWQRKIVLINFHFLYVFFNPYKGLSGFTRSLKPNEELFKHEISKFFLFGGQFWPTKIQIWIENQAPDPLHLDPIQIRIPASKILFLS
jgi:hypothetical protein